jgi:hypothetical protein
MTKLFIATLLATSFLSSEQICAQQQPPPATRFDIAATYNANRANVTDGTTFWAQGGGVEADIAVAHHFGLTASFNGSHAGNAATSQAPFSLLTFTVGPCYSWVLPRKAKACRRPLRTRPLRGCARVRYEFARSDNQRVKLCATDWGWCEYCRCAFVRRSRD